MGNKADDAQYEREQQAHAQQFQDGENLERIANALEGLLNNAAQIVTALQLQALKTAPTAETWLAGATMLVQLDELMLRHERITRAKPRPTDG